MVHHFCQVSLRGFYVTIAVNYLNFKILEKLLIKKLKADRLRCMITVKHDTLK